METILGLLIGVGLSAACGFRVFVPLLVCSVGSYSGHLHLPDAMAWVGSTPALIAFGVATVIEVLGYLVPWFDHLLDVLAIPAAIAAGTLITSGMMGDASPFLRWSVALVAGGGAAGITGMTTAAIRGGSTATTGGLANPLFALAESATSLIAAIVTIVVPVLAFIVFAVFFGCAVVWLAKRWLKPRSGKMALKMESSWDGLSD